MCKWSLLLLLFYGFIIVSSRAIKPQSDIVIGVSQCSEDIWRTKLNDELLIGTYDYKNVDLLFASAKDNDQTTSKAN